MSPKWLWARIDDRLLHGQVVTAWLPYLNPDMVACVPSAGADAAFLEEIYRSVLPRGVELWIGSIAELEDAVRSSKIDPMRTLLLLQGVMEAVVLDERHLLGGVLNLGCVAARGVSVRVHPQVALTGQEETLMRTLAGNDVRVFTQAVPSERMKEWPGGRG